MLLEGLVVYNRFCAVKERLVMVDVVFALCRSDGGGNHGRIGHFGTLWKS